MERSNTNILHSHIITNFLPGGLLNIYIYYQVYFKHIQINKYTILQVVKDTRLPSYGSYRVDPKQTGIQVSHHRLANTNGIWLNSMTKLFEIREGFSNMRPIKNYHTLMFSLDQIQMIPV